MQEQFDELTKTARGIAKVYFPLPPGDYDEKCLDSFVLNEQEDILILGLGIVTKGTPVLFLPTMPELGEENGF